MSSVIEIGVVCYPNAQEAAVLGLRDMFEIASGLATTDAAIQLTRWSLGADGELLRAAEFDGGSWPAVLLLPPGIGGPLGRSEAAAYSDALKRHHGQGTILASVCAGSFILAETGLLDGRRATTHWTFEREYRSRFPRVQLEIGALLVVEADIITAGGMMAWTDLGLKLVDRFLGPSAMLETARMLLIDPPGREQRYYSSFVPALNHGDAAILAAQHWLHARYAQDIRVGALADKAGLGERTFLRRFRAATGMTSTEYLQQTRMNRAREMLQFGPSSIDEVAWQSGYADASAFRKVFIQIVGLSPTEYRSRFQR